MHLATGCDQANCFLLGEEKDNIRELLRAFFTGGPSKRHPADRCCFMKALPSTKTRSPLMDGAKYAQSSSVAIFIL